MQPFWIISDKTIIPKQKQGLQFINMIAEIPIKWDDFNSEADSSLVLNSIFSPTTFPKLTLCYISFCLFLKYYFPLIKQLLHKGRSLSVLFTDLS